MSHSAGITSNMHHVRSFLKMKIFQVESEGQSTHSLQIPHFYSNVADKNLTCFCNCESMHVIILQVLMGSNK